MNRPLGIGIIGLLGYGQTYFKQLRGLEGVQIVALCDANEQTLHRVADQQGIALRHTDYRDMLKNDAIDAVFIATPHFLHYRMTLDALNAGKHVFCEKPLAMNAAEADEMAGLATEKGLKLSCHFNRRQSSPVKLLTDANRRGVFGSVYAMNVKWMARYTAFMFAENSSWRVKKDKAGGGILIGRGSHMIDAALYILDMPKIQAITATTANRLTGFEVEDYAQVTMKLQNGCVLHVEVSYENNIPHYEEKIEYEIFGTKAGAYACLKDGVSECALGACRFPENRFVDLSGDFVEADYTDAYPQSIVLDFIDALKQDRKPLITGEDGAYITRILDCAYRSAEENREIIL